MNFSEAMFYENYLTSDFHTNKTCLLTHQDGFQNRDKVYQYVEIKKLEIVFASYADALWDRHAFLPQEHEERMRDDPKKSKERRTLKLCQISKDIDLISIQNTIDLRAELHDRLGDSRGYIVNNLLKVKFLKPIYNQVCTVARRLNRSEAGVEFV